MSLVQNDGFIALHPSFTLASVVVMEITMQQIAVLGTGAMGSRLVANLMDAGYGVTVYNRTQERAEPLVLKGATYMATPRAAAKGADVVISMVRDDEASRQIWLADDIGAVHGIAEGAIAIELSTLTVDWTRTLAAAIANHNHAFLAVPVVGSRPQAEAKQLIGLVGGAQAALAQVQPLLEAAGISSLQWVGSAAQSMAMKLAVNALFGIQVAALAELLASLGRSEISREQAMDIFSQLPVLSPAARGAGSLMQKEQHSPLFPIELVEKDFRYAISAAQTSGSMDEFSAPVTTAVWQLYQQAATQQYRSVNITGIINLFT
ncbi:MAG: NAD(P)-dependent oxidoreductase [Cyanobacteria bacterium J06628_6]